MACCAARANKDSGDIRAGYAGCNASCNLRTVLWLSFAQVNASGSAATHDKPPSVMDMPGIAKPPDPRSGSSAPQGAWTVRFGFYLPTRGPTATREGVLALAREGEQLGLYSTMVADHIVFPVESQSTYPY